LSTEAAQRINNRFQQALHEHVIANHDVAFYADYLQISPDYLTRCVKRVTGDTPKAVIQDRLIVRTRDLLRENLPIAEVAHRLGFESSAYFSRFVRRMAGTTPKQLQKRLC
jgi:AraC-like DNA-binding protein